MYKSDYFNRLSTERQAEWHDRANSLHDQRIPPADMGNDDLGACIWYGDREFHRWRQTPPTEIPELEKFMAFQRWLIDLKREWINRQMIKKANSPTRHVRPLLQTTNID